ncbi:MAG: PspC domain-containing protein [Paenibacillaceae bacterium]
MTKLYRSQRDKKVFGLCGGLAETFNIDATILRVIVAAGVIFSGGAVLLLYIVASLVIPKESDLYNAQPQHSGFGHQGWNPPSPGPGMSPPNAYKQAPPHQTAPVQATSPSIDELMKDIEKKAMQNEIDQLKARLAKLEKGDE